MAKESHTELTVKERRKILFKRLELSGLESWTEENKERALNLFAEYHNIFALEDGEMGYTEVAEHKIVLDVDVIKSSKWAWCNAVVLVQKKDGGLRFYHQFSKAKCSNLKGHLSTPSNT